MLFLLERMQRWDEIRKSELVKQWIPARNTELHLVQPTTNSFSPGMSTTQMTPDPFQLPYHRLL